MDSLRDSTKHSSGRAFELDLRTASCASTERNQVRHSNHSGACAAVERHRHVRDEGGTARAIWPIRLWSRRKPRRKPSNKPPQRPGDSAEHPRSRNAATSGTVHRFRGARNRTGRTRDAPVSEHPAPEHVLRGSRIAERCGGVALSLAQTFSECGFLFLISPRIHSVACSAEESSAACQNISPMHDRKALITKIWDS